jgi:thiol-disulfide isomerase/thioredoxin
MVYVDVWATWCSPCIKEIPNVEKLMEEYKGKDIVFMGVSIDAAKDKTKWKNFVKEKQLKGIQMYAGKEHEFTKVYQISSIPRFMLFDKKGNIVSTDAPRPGAPEIRVLINKGLKE